ncbi:MAG: hypothetical protein ACLFP0_09205, partial [Rhodosalinus sp.]
ADADRERDAGQKPRQRACGRRQSRPAAASGVVCAALEGLHPTGTPHMAAARSGLQRRRDRDGATGPSAVPNIDKGPRQEGVPMADEPDPAPHGIPVVGHPRPGRDPVATTRDIA